MNITLEMVDEVIARTNVGYGLAKEILEKNNGNVLEAVVEIEKMQQFNSKNEHHAKSTQITDWIKKLIQEGLIRQVIIEKNDKVVLDIPIAAGALAGVFLTKSTLIGIGAAIATGCQIYVVKKDGERIHLNQLTMDTFESIRNMFVCDETCCEDKTLQKEEPVVKSYQNNDLGCDDKEE